jgi:DNA-binding response OmpR family regulator
LLDIEGFEVQQATNLDNVVEDIEKASAEIVLMDVYLEKHNGIEMLVELRKNNRLKNTKVIMSSGMDFREECLAKGANDFILKPYMPDELIKKIKNFTE